MGVISNLAPFLNYLRTLDEGSRPPRSRPTEVGQGERGAIMGCDKEHIWHRGRYTYLVSNFREREGRTEGLSVYSPRACCDPRQLFR